MVLLLQLPIHQRASSFHSKGSFPGAVINFVCSRNTVAYLKNAAVSSSARSACSFSGRSHTVLSITMSKLLIPGEVFNWHETLTILFAKSPLPDMRALRLGPLKPQLGLVAGAVGLDTFTHAYHHFKCCVRGLCLTNGCVCRPSLAVAPFHISKKISRQRFANRFPLLAVRKLVGSIVHSVTAY